MVAPSLTTTMGLLTFVVALTFPLLAWYVWDERSKPGVIWFLGATTAALCWTVAYGLSLLVRDPWVTEALVGSGYLFIGIGLVCWIAVIFEYVTGARATPVAAALLLVPSVAEQVLLWVDGTRHLVHAQGSFVDTAGVFHAEPGPYFLAVTVYYSILIVSGFSMLVPAFIRSEGSRRQQTGLLLATTLAFILGAAVTIAFDLEPFHPLLMTFPVVNGMLAYALVGYRLFEVTPVGRETTVEEMDDAVIMLDRADVVTDTNPAARQLFGLSDRDLGEPVEVALPGTGPLTDALASDDAFRGELTLPVDGTERHFDVQVTGISQGEWQRGRVVVLRDISALKRREEELGLLKQVFARVFRHNIRNEMTVLRGYAEVAREREGNALEASIDQILESSDRILDHSEKAQVIERVVGETDLRTFDLVTVVERSVREATRGRTDVTVERHVADGLTVRAHPEFPAAVQELLENAIGHAPADTSPWVAVRAETRGSTAVLSVEDESGGLEAEEIEILEEGTEGTLKHGSGVGLWLVRFVVDWSQGDLDLETTETGTLARITLPLAETAPTQESGD